MERLKNMSLKKSFFLLTLWGLLAALLLTLLLWWCCTAVAARYPSGGMLIGADGAASLLPYPTPEQARLLNVLEFIKLAGCVVFPVLGLSGAAALFYRWKLKQPIALLRESAERIRAHDLDFSVPDVSKDELGEVCAAFESMRAELLKSNRTLWRQAEERKRLNAAFAHDLRNPITVLKGSVKLLRQGAADEQALARLESHTLRIEQYVEAMSGIQRLEQLPVRTEAVSAAALHADLEETAQTLAPALTMTLRVSEFEAVSIDRSVFLTVAENLIGNAARFARTSLQITLALADGALSLSVGDDGPGLPGALLKDGPKPFGKMTESAEHFGMGLYSSSLLCEKHGGTLRLESRPEGGALLTATFQINCGS